VEAVAVDTNLLLHPNNHSKTKWRLAGLGDTQGGSGR